MKYRTLSTLLIWILIIASLVFGGVIAGIILLTIAGILTQWELYKLFNKMGYRPHTILGLACGALILLGSYVIPLITNWVPLAVYVDLLTLCLVVVIMCLLLAHPKDESEHFFDKRTLPTLFGIIYVPFMLQFYIRLAQNYVSVGFDTWGLMLVIWLIVVAKFTDVGGLLIGTLIGKNKMAPEISPKKTWEGALGGMVVSSILGVLLVMLLPTFFPPNFTPFIAFLITIPVAIVSIISDLVESVIKRRAGVKDSGDVIPGIGGAFDLTDSLLLTAPIGYMLMRYSLM